MQALSSDIEWKAFALLLCNRMVASHTNLLGKIMIYAKRTVLILSAVLACAVGEIASGRSAIALSAQAEIVAQIETENTDEIPTETAPEETAPENLGEPVEEIPADSDVQADPAQRAQVEELLELTNADALNVQILEQVIAQFRQMAPEIPDEWWESFAAKALETDMNSLLIPIYERNYTATEIDGLIEFYQSPLGQSLLAKTPIVMQESIAVGQAWGLEIVEEMTQELEADGYEFPPAPFSADPEPMPQSMPQPQ